VAVDGEIKQLVEVKLNVVSPASRALPKTDVIDARPNEVKDLDNDTICLQNSEPGEPK